MAYPTVDSPVLPGQKNLAGNDDVLYLDMYAGEVIRKFREKNLMMGLHKVKSVGPGKSFQFPKIGKVGTAYHIRGESLLDDSANGGSGYLQTPEHSEQVINVDKILLSPIFVDNWDEVIRHFETRSEYSFQQGAALARRMDEQLFQLLALTARDGGTLTDSINASTEGGTVLSSGLGGVSTSASLMLDAMVSAAATFAENDVPMDELYFAVRPRMFFLLIKSGEFIDKDFNPASNGSKAEGQLRHALGFNVVWSNNIPSTNLTGLGDAGEKNTYVGDFRETVALAWHKEAVATVMRQGVMLESEYQVERQGTLAVAKTIVGHGILRPECVVEIQDPDIVPAP